MTLIAQKLRLKGQRFDLQIQRTITQPPDAPRLVVVSFQPNESTREILRVCIESIQRYTPEPHELWIVDNNSPAENTDWLLKLPNINVVLNRTQPIPPEGRRWWKPEPRSFSWGSYDNAIALEIAIRLIDPQTRYLMTLHQDILVCHAGWLSFLKSKIQGKVGASGVRLDTQRTPEGILHVLGYLVDFQLFKRLKLDFYPALPQYDVGDRVTIHLRKAGYEVFHCHNTLHEPELIPKAPPHFQELYMDRVFDDDWNVFFLHLGRGVRKSEGYHTKGTMPEDWIHFAETYLLS